MAPERVARIPRLCADWVEQGLMPALVVLAARRGVIVLHEAFGRLGPEPDAPPLPRDAIFPVASITKPMTATAVMGLVEDGLLGLNRPVQEYVPEFVGAGKEGAMVHHLLTHTSGLRDEDLNVHLAGKLNAGELARLEDTPYQYVNANPYTRYFAAAHDAPLWRAPGAEMSYCTYGYGLLGQIVGRISGRPQAEVVRERIFAPLGMADSSYSVPTADMIRLVRRGLDAPHSWAGAWALPEGMYGGAGVYSTARDLAVFGQMFLNGGRYGQVRVLSPASVAEMTRNQIPGVSAHWAGEFFPEASWGYGWGVQGNKKAVRHGSLLSPSTFGHGGIGMMYLWIDPVAELVGVYLSVALAMISARIGDSCVDLFMNAVTAAVTD